MLSVPQFVGEGEGEITDGPRLTLERRNDGDPLEIALVIPDSVANTGPPKVSRQRNGVPHTPKLARQRQQGRVMQWAGIFVQPFEHFVFLEQGLALGGSVRT